MKNHIIIMFAAILSFQDVVCQDNDSGIRIMLYNVENLFDTYDDSLKEDNDFLPYGAMGWSYARYNRKISSLFKTIIAAGEWNPPAIVAFCEVENRRVLNDLISDTYLSRFEYEIVHEESPDPRGIDVCLIYRKNHARLMTYRYLEPCMPDDDVFETRSILYAKFLLNGDTLHLFVNHWPSRIGGSLARADMRMKIATMEKQFCDSLLSVNPESKIVIGGDLNCSPEDREIEILKDSSGRSGLINLSETLAGKSAGTYRYRGVWEMIDQVLVSESLVDKESAIFTDAGSLRIFDAAFLLEKDPVYPGLSPNRTYRGRRYNGGFSDHLPVLLDIHFKE